MAESQAQYNYTSAGETIRGDLSEERFTPYLEKAGWHEEYAFNLYLYNARLSKSFLYPLHILEVVLRNRINSIFCSNHGSSWPHNPAFRSILTSESLNALDNGIRRAVSSKTEDVVATLTFDFWSNLFRDEYDRSLWQTQMHVLLPNKHQTRKDFQAVVKNFNKFRNRIAHHEPIHTMDISKYHKDILDVIGWLSTESSSWVKHHSTVSSIIRTKPAPNGEPKPHFKERCDPNFSIHPSSLPLSGLYASSFFIIATEDDSILAVVAREHICKYLFSLVEKSEILADLTEHTLNMVITHQNLKDNYVTCSDEESFGKAERLLRRKVNYLIVKNRFGVTGVIAKAHRRY
ncbi:hypothetical protein [Halomonas sp. AOP43-D1-12]|uniref:hypothetical protein n=1 Tax=Halomonas sp. AOP43-D1-12 TaxID=3457660 RepID=UPI00403326F5